MLSKFLNPKNDLAFKRIFGNERNKDILIHFLNDIFNFKDNPVKEVTFLKSNQDPEIAALRESIVDVLCSNTIGDKFIVEMQVDKEPGFTKRAQYYAAKTYIEQRDKGITYPNLKQVTFLAITDFKLFPKKKAYLCHHAMLDRESGEHDLKDFSFSFLELPKFKKKKSELKTITEKWAYFFKNAQNTLEQDLPTIVGEDHIIQRAFDELDRFAWSPEELRNYDSVDMKQEANKAIMEGARAEGKAEGKAEGEAIGEARGESKGEIKKAKNIAINLLKKNMPIKDIADITGLTIAEVKELQKITVNI